MTTYETGILTGKQADIFIELFDDNIGTETEINNFNNDEFTVVCHEITSAEAKKCARFETIAKKA